MKRLYSLCSGGWGLHCKALKVITVVIYIMLYRLADYRQWEVQKPEKVGGKNDYLPPTTPFEGNSRYKSDFPVHGRTPRESFKPVENTIRSDAPFEGMTEARKSYVMHAGGTRSFRGRARPCWQGGWSRDGVTSCMRCLDARRRRNRSGSRAPLAWMRFPLVAKT